MTARVLPPSEWHRLDGTHVGTIAPTLDPAFAEVLVVEDGDRIVGSIAILTTLHAECLQLDGKTGAARLLWKLLRERVKQAGGSAVWGAAVDWPMQRLLERHAEPIPGDHFLVKV